MITHELLRSLGKKPRRGSILACQICGKEFYRKTSHVGRSKYCSYSCMGKANEKKAERTCLGCGNAFLLPPSSISHRGGNFCSKKCKGAHVSQLAELKPRSRSGRRIHISAIDNQFSRYIRSRDKLMCQRCGKQIPFGSAGLHTAHFIGRANRAVRFDEDNCVALCWGCHQFMDTHKATHYRDFMVSRLGQERYDALIARSNLHIKRTNADIKELVVQFRAKCAELQQVAELEGSGT